MLSVDSSECLAFIREIEAKLTSTGFCLEIGGCDVVNISHHPTEYGPDCYRIRYTTNYPQVYQRDVRNADSYIAHGDPTSPHLASTEDTKVKTRYRVSRLSLHPYIITGISGEDSDLSDGYLYTADVEVPIPYGRGFNILQLSIPLNRHGLNRAASKALSVAESEDVVGHIRQ
jgi:hypothetical protein